MSAARSYSSHGAWEAAGVALAKRYGMSAGAVRFYVGTRDGQEVFRALSRRTWRHEYEVTYTPSSDSVEHCTCPAQGVCWHIGAARMWIERRKVRSSVAA